MRKINILTKSVYNKIAAGEVVDSPYSVVKELVENSLDAEATEIEIYIENGGKQLVKVVDNGTGIDREDLRAAFFPHATSKIATAEDIEEISTLGFRGEALASISAVSEVELTSVTDGNPAYRVVSIDGNVGAVERAALDRGTEISIRNLFYNTPARAKFLRPDKKEESDITNLVTRFILGKCDVSFRYFVDGKLVLQSDGSGFDQAIAQVYGAKTIANCFKIDYEENGIRLYGFISNQHYFKPNKTYQTTFLNGRYIVNNTISTAVARCYATYAMKRQYPFYVLNLEIPKKFIDVNVHPNKMDVRILNAHSVFSLIYTVLTNVLDGTAKAAQFVVGGQMPEVKSTMPKAQTEEIPAMPPISFSFKPQKPVASTNLNSNENKSRASGEEFDYNFYDVVGENKAQDYYLTVSNDSIPFGLGEDPRIDEAYERKKYEQQMIEYESFKFKGDLFNTYLLYEVRDTVYIIDQHAAHERLIYDRLREKIANRKVERQILLEPYLFGANAQESAFIENNIDVIRNIGFEINPFGSGAYRVDEIPADLKDLNAEEFFNELLSDIKSLSEIKLEDILKDKIAMAACKHAVKGGMKLTEEEVDKLFKMLDGNMGLKCPHGRPVCVALDKKDLEKMFKRIV